jgi:hypothetical protein
MAKEAPKPILMDGLTLTEKIHLGATAMTPGYQVIIKMFEAICRKLTEDAIKVDPEEDNYDQILRAKQQEARTANKFAALFLKSVDYHREYGVAEQAQMNIDATKEIKQSL